MPEEQDQVPMDEVIAGIRRIFSEEGDCVQLPLSNAAVRAARQQLITDAVLIGDILEGNRVAYAYIKSKPPRKPGTFREYFNTSTAMDKALLAELAGVAYLPIILPSETLWP